MAGTPAAGVKSDNCLLPKESTQIKHHPRRVATFNSHNAPKHATATAGLAPAALCLLPGTAEVPEAQAVNVPNRSYTIGALVDIPAPGAQGVLFAHGSRFGGHALYVKDNRLHYAYNFVGMMEQKIDATQTCPPART
jgi:hypothetical protein